ncbi:NADPH-dependent F420 reductase [Polluticaenibacter yanchengensis]|uniref:NAD(P)-binding domain-containing protein n=1 Tax=Polluticaenibacter yanchengensis TaxID=3014562 RepID=A0ABT4UPC9_9BACT|nr:NAD(P)-binding domain-containing protein [Chitinophagaceae bacterium LY-5]
MKAKLVIAIIGSTGNMGTSIAKSLAHPNHKLLLFSNDLSKAKELKTTIESNTSLVEVEVQECPGEASWEADIVILAVPFTAESEIAAKIKPYVTQKIVISIANPLNNNYDGLLTAPGTSAAEELQKQLPDAIVIKAFNTTFAADFAQPVIDGKQTDAFIAGDNQAAVNAVAELVKVAGFNPVHAGKLSVSSTLENMQLLLIQLNIQNNYNWHAGWKILH